MTTSSTVSSLAADTSCASVATLAPGRTHTSPLSGAMPRVISCHERGLALAIAAEQAHPLAAADLQRGVVEERLQAEAQRDFVEAYGGHEAAYSMRLRPSTHV